MLALALSLYFYALSQGPDLIDGYSNTTNRKCKKKHSSFDFVAKSSVLFGPAAGMTLTCSVLSEVLLFASFALLRHNAVEQ